MSLVGKGGDSNPVIPGLIPTTVGTVVLPNTGTHRAVAVAAMISIAVGVAILLTTFTRMILKKVYAAK